MGSPRVPILQRREREREIALFSAEKKKPPKFFFHSVCCVRSFFLGGFAQPAFFFARFLLFLGNELRIHILFHASPDQRPRKEKKLGQATINTAHEADSRTEHCCRKVPAAAMIPPSPRPGRGGFLINSIYLRSPFHHATVLRTTTTFGTSSNARKERPDDQCLAAFSPSRQRVRCRISFSLFMFGEKRESK